MPIKRTRKRTIAKSKKKTASKNNPMTGKKVSDLLAITQSEIEEMARTDPKMLSKIVTRLVSAGNKRIRRIIESGYQSKAVQLARKAGERQIDMGRDLSDPQFFSAKGLQNNPEGLIAEYTRISQFFAEGSSTVKGARTYTEGWKPVNDILGEEFADFIEQLFDFPDSTTFEDYNTLDDGEMLDEHGNKIKTRRDLAEEFNEDPFAWQDNIDTGGLTF